MAALIAAAMHGEWAALHHLRCKFTGSAVGTGILVQHAHDCFEHGTHLENFAHKYEHWEYIKLVLLKVSHHNLHNKLEGLIELIPQPVTINMLERCCKTVVYVGNHSHWIFG